MLQTAKKWSLPALALGSGLMLGIALTGQSSAVKPSGPAPVDVIADGDKVRVKPSIPDVVRRVSPAVVSVGAVKRAIVYEPYYDYFMPFFRQRQLDQRMPYLGSGFLVDKQGHILTNYHVIQDSLEVFVTLPNGLQTAAEVVETDRFVDVALLKIDVPAEELPEPLTIGDSDSLEIGETALALGNPFGNMMEDPRPTVTMGVISALHRSFRPDQENLRVYHDMIQTDAAINPGNSGGPLIDDEGNAIGLNTFIMSGTGGSVGLGFAIPSARFRSFIEEVQKYGRLRRLLIDFNVMTMHTPRVDGALITDLRPDGPAVKAGLETGDVITKVNGRPIFTREDLILILASRQVGDKMTFDIWRSGDEKQKTYEIEEAGKESN